MSKHLVDMRRSKKERKSEEVAIDNEPSIPFGLSINLDDLSLEKLGMSKLPAVGDRMVVASIGVVDSVNEHSSSRRKSRSVSIQLEKLDVSPVPTRKASSAEEAITAALQDV